MPLTNCLSDIEGLYLTVSLGVPLSESLSLSASLRLPLPDCLSRNVSL